MSPYRSISWATVLTNGKSWFGVRTPAVLNILISKGLGAHAAACTILPSWPWFWNFRVVEYDTQLLLPRLRICGATLANAPPPPPHGFRSVTHKDNFASIFIFWVTVLGTRITFIRSVLCCGVIILLNACTLATNVTNFNCSFIDTSEIVLYEGVLISL